VDFFIRSKVKHLYSNMGSPSIDPEVLIRMLLIVDIFMASLQKESYVKKSRYIPVCRRAGMNRNGFYPRGLLTSK